MSKVFNGGVVLLAMLLALLGAGCAYRQSEKTRASSFNPHVARRIDQVDIETFLRSRVALLISCDQCPTNQWAAGDLIVPTKSGFGCAAAIDSRGYFLTAAHCLKRKESYAILYDADAQTVRALRARVVWQGNSENGQPDLGIIHVKRALAHTFDWADAVHKAEAVMAVGLAWTNQPSRVPHGFTMLGGSILDYQALQSDVSHVRVESDVPLQPGDSGGPLVDTTGRLIGINVEGTPPFIHWVLPKGVFPMVAHGLNQKYLQELIEEDVSRCQREAAGQFEQ